MKGPSLPLKTSKKGFDGKDTMNPRERAYIMAVLRLRVRCATRFLSISCEIALFSHQKNSVTINVSSICRW